MAQLVEFPYLPPGEPDSAVNALIRLCREMPASGEPFPAFRERMKGLRLWERDRMQGTFAFLGIARSGSVAPSPLMRKVAAGKGDAAAREALAAHLWEVNQLLFKGVIERLSERVHPRDELIKYVDSYAYRGARPARPQLEAWIKLALGLGILKLVGIALDLDERGKGFLDVARQLDVDDYLEDEAQAAAEQAGPTADADAADHDEPGGADGDGLVSTTPAGRTPGASEPTPSAPAVSGPAPATAGAASGLAGAASVPAPEGLPSPLGKGRPVDASRFVGHATFPDDVLAETTARIESWWAEHSPARAGAAAADFGFDSEQWMEGAPELLYRIAVAAALVFRLGGGRDRAVAAYRALDAAGVLSALHDGTAPDALPDGMDARALMLASLVARRCAEAPDLAAALEAQDSAADAFARLGDALGRGLFRLELFWVMGALADVGALRRPDVADLVAVPHRLARDVLFRLGFLATPYAGRDDDLVSAARAARRAAGAASPPHEVLAAFALAAGCAYDCPGRRRCDLACRERGE